MDFFESQDVARRKTGRLVGLFGLAVVLIVLSIYAVSMIAMGFAGAKLQGDNPGGAGPGFQIWDPLVALAAGGGALLVIGGGTLYKLAELRAGGRVIAEQMGGKLLAHDTASGAERQLLNIVEEMALASGTPVPPVYLLDRERGVNAFAAGYRPEDAVIGVTRGAAEALSRDQMQGVIAHEFSHILSGDMRTNIRLIGVLHGILIIGVTGATVLRMAAYSGVGRSSDRKNNPIPLLVIGLGLTVVGYIGVFFGSWIKAAVSRQREYFADAAAVQFTRNPAGIGGALKVIGGARSGSSVASPAAAEASHMFFGQALRGGLYSMFASHPPLKDRIKRIEPSWDGSMIETVVPSAGPGSASGRSPVTAGFAGAATRGRGEPMGVAAAALVGSAGNVADRHLAYSRRTLSRIPESLRDAAHEPFAARAVVLALLLDMDVQVQAEQVKLIERGDRPLASEVRRLWRDVAGLDRELRLPLIEIALQPLRSLSPTQASGFRSQLEGLIRADDRVSTFEWILHRIVTRTIAGGNEQRKSRVRYYGLGQLGGHLGVLLSTLAATGHHDQAEAEGVFRSGAASLTGVTVPFKTKSELTLKALDQALTELEGTAPKLKKHVLSACAAVIAHDRTITPGEAELFRAVAESLGVPIPPVVPGNVGG